MEKGLRPVGQVGRGGSAHADAKLGPAVVGKGPLDSPWGAEAHFQVSLRAKGPEQMLRLLRVSLLRYCPKRKESRG